MRDDLRRAQRTRVPGAVGVGGKRGCVAQGHRAAAGGVDATLGLDASDDKFFDSSGRQLALERGFVKCVGRPFSNHWLARGWRDDWVNRPAGRAWLNRVAAIAV